MSECGRDCGCRSDVSRRDFLKVGVGAAGLVVAGQAAQAEVGHIPAECRVPPGKEWFDQLTRPGQTIVYTGEHLKNLIFPLGGIGTGTIWLNGSGRLVNWQIFNNIQKNSLVDDTFFAVRVQPEGRPAVVRVLQSEPVGPFAPFREIRFVGQYPVARLSFSDPDLPVEIELEAFNPLIPLNEKDSAIPCAIFTLRVTNRTGKPVQVSLLSSLQNAVGHAGQGASRGVTHPTYGGNINMPVTDDRMVAVSMKAEPGKPAEIRPPVELLMDHQILPMVSESPVTGLSFIGVGRPSTNPSIQRVCWLATGDLKLLGGAALKQIPESVREFGAILLLSGSRNPLLGPVKATVDPKIRRRETVFAGFDDRSFGQWTPAGEAFRKPRAGTAPGQNPVTGFLGAGLVNSYDPDDEPQGTLTSPAFVITERYISFLLGGGNHPNECCINLKVDGKVVRTATGKDSEHLERMNWDVSEFVNKEARIELVDRRSDGWGHILADDIRFGNLLTEAVTVEEAEAWNALVEEGRKAGPGQAAGVGRGKIILMPEELARPEPKMGESALRDKLLSMIARWAGAAYLPQVGRPPASPSSGTMCLATPETDASMLYDWTDREQLHRLLADSGRLQTFKPVSQSGDAAPSAGPTAPRQTVNAALCVERNVPAGRSAEATFLFTWHFPHQYYPQNSYREFGRGALAVGTMYDNWHHDALDVVRYILADLANLRRQTFAWRDAMFDTTLPQYLVDAAAANVSIIRGPTCFWTKDGTFYGYEGCNFGGGGCCPMNCNHVWNYEQTLAKLWPSLERDMRKTELRFHQRPDGGIYHRVTVPRDNPRKGSGPVADGQCGAVLKAYREYLQSADRHFLDEYWERIKKAMDFAIRTWDKDSDGIMEQPQFNTYDRDIYGKNTFVSSLYLAALRAAEEMARLCGEQPTADRYRQLFDKGREKIARTLFDGEYYIQDIDSAIACRRAFEQERAKATGKPPIPVGEQEGLQGGYGKGCWADQVVGQWWARVLNLGDILPNKQVLSALKSICKYNWLWRVDGFEGTQRYLQFADGTDKCLLCGSWPKGGRPADPILYRDEAWTGVEYQVAAHKLYEHQIEEGLVIVRGARERYDGIKRSPWNEIECGDYYARAMSSWSLMLAAQGYAHNGPARKLAFDPRLAADDHRSSFSTAEGWGRFEQKRTGKTQTAALSFLYGRCDLKELRLGLPAGAKTVTGKIRLDDSPLVAETALENGAAIVRLGSPITALAGNTVHVELTWT